MGIGAWVDRPMPTGKMSLLRLPPCDADHNFRTIQNDSE